MATVDISSILNAVNNQNYSSQTVADTIISDTNAVQAAGEDKLKSITQQTDSQIIVDSAKASGELRAQQNSRNAATSLGTNMDLASSVINSLGSRMVDEYTKADINLQAIHNKESTGFLDSPLQYIANQFTLPQDREEYNYHAQRFNLAEQALASLNSATQSTTLTQNAIAEIKTAASLEAATQVTKAKSAQLADEVKQQNLLYNIQGLKIVQDINQQGVDLLFKTQSALVSQENLDIARQHLEETRKVHMLQLEERQDKIDKNKADLAEVQELGKTINDGRFSLGLAPIPTGRAIQLMKMGGDIGNQIKYQYSIGALQQSVGKPIIAEEPGMAAKVVTETQAPLSPAMDPIRKLLTSVYSDAATGKLDKKIDIKNEGQVIGATNSTIKTVVSNMAANIKTGDTTNIYAAPDLASVSTSQAVQDSVLYQKVFQPALVAGNLTESNPDLLISLATNATQKGIISYEEAVQGITNYYKQVTLLNNTTKDYSRVGITPQTTFNTKIQDPTGLMTKYDLTNPTMVSNLIAKKLAAYRIGSSMLSPGIIDFSSLYQ